MSKKPAIVLGMTANGLSVVRSLGRKGIPVIGIDSDRSKPGMYSRYCSHHICPNVLEEEKEFLEFLIDAGKKLTRRGIIYATSDEYISVISQYRDRLAEYFQFLYPPHEIVCSFLDKEETYRLTHKYGIAFPFTYFIKHDDDILRISSQIRYPCIIKPRFSHVWRQRHGARKVFVVNSADGLINMYRAVQRDCLDIVVQEIIPGPDKNVYIFMAYFDQNSDPLALFCCRKLRQYPPHFGIGSLVESVVEPKVIETGVRFLKALGYKGLIGLEFKIHSHTHIPVFLEANLRTCFVGQISIASGIDLPYIAYQDMVDGSRSQRGLQSSFQEGVKLLNIDLDIGSFIRYRKEKTLSFFRWVCAFKAKKIAHTYFAVDDIKPWLIVYLRFLKRGIIKLIRKILAMPQKECLAQPGVKIAHIISSNGLFGAEKVMLSLAKQMNCNGIKSWVVAVNNLHNPHLEVIGAADAAVPTHIIPSRGRFDLKAAKSLYDFMRENHIDIIHTHNYKANVLGFLAAKRAQIPVVATLHGYIGEDIRLRAYERLDRYILRFFNKVIFVDESLKKWFRNNSVKSTVIHNGVQIEHSSKFKTTVSSSNGHMVIGSVGRLSSEKGHACLLEAFAKVAKEYPRARLLIVGDGDKRKDLE
ncbi:MAG: glycosyltransferase, partial [Candidatus Omnitrophota bacterium]